MRLDRIHEITKSFGFYLKASSSYEYDLFDNQGRYVDTLHGNQINELQETDFIEFYLKD